MWHYLVLSVTQRQHGPSSEKTRLSRGNELFPDTLTLLQCCCLLFSFTHSDTLFPPVITSFLSVWRQARRKKVERKSPEVHISFPLLCSRKFFWWIWEKTREASRPYTLLRTPPSILSHPFIHAFILFFIIRLFSRQWNTNLSKCLCTGDKLATQNQSQNHWCKEVWMLKKSWERISISV